ncbi:MBL fold metallo-hydrolase [Ottowia flava]|uniref:MBL fold metallo-hydrolase n=1 Tax=Ottowia flava TaxID=2675430 RepID=A0ABW4KXV6_9BURK|nr:MBL fold metallo-hydrolase [Ottowia sp. GY511]
MQGAIDRRQVLQRCVCAAFGGAALAWSRYGNAADAPAAPVEMQPHEVVPGCWYVEGLSALGSPANQNFISNAGFVVTSDSVVVIDALGSPALAERLLAEIAKITPKKVSHVIVTHYHADHVYGLQVFQQAGARIIAHQAGREYLFSDTARLRLQASRDELKPWINDQTHLVNATEWIDAKRDLTVGDTRFVLQPVGPAHTPEDVAVYIPSRKVLYAGDLVFRNRIPFVGQADSRNWIESLGKLLTFDAQVIVPGHGPASTEARKDMQLTRDYLVYLRKTMGEAARDMTPFDEAYKATDWSQYEHMPLFGPANRMNAYNTYLLMEHETP